ncbi:MULTISPECIES: DnaB-like helicase C-terminal domain-containing protein [unclassified Bradyrhizobium]|uniref:DnaB-like helicase C-terminal domain-containing protein n=1 Tax=unclassified Bradyrhizobium TaxID=2631580 RepID=UPI00339881F6
MASQTAINLLSALRRSGSTSAVRDTPETYFIEPDELAAFRWLKEHVTRHRTFPDPNMFRRGTGITTLQVAQPLAYYTDQARLAALYNACMGAYEEMRNALERKDPDAFVAHMRQTLLQSGTFNSQSADFVPLSAGMEHVLADFQEAHRTTGLRGIPTGYHYLDELTGGWFADDLISIVGRIGVGKTYLMLIFAYAAWRAGYNVLFVSMELGATQLFRRLFGIHTKINPSMIRTGRLSTFISNQMTEMASTMDNGIPFNVIVGGFKKSVETVQAVADATDPDLICVDAGYLLKPTTKRKNSDGRREAISDTIEDLKRITIERRRPLIQSTQFNRSAESVRTRDTSQNGANPLSHLNMAKIGETDVIGQSSSIVAAAAKAFAPYADTRRWFGLMKNREGTLGRMLLNYQFSPVNFDMISAGSEEDDEAPPLDVSRMI